MAVKKFRALAISGAIAFMLAVTLPFLGRNGLWFDEIFSVTTAATWTRMGEVFSQFENNMALYYIILHCWMVIGDSEFTVRLLSVLFGCATIPVLHLLASRLFDLRVAIIADFLLVGNTLFLYHAMEARSYSLLVLLATTGSLLFISGLRQPRWSIWIAYAVIMAAAVYAHYFGALVVIAHVVALLWPGRPVIPWRQGIVAGLLVSLFLLPLLLLRPASTSQVDWIEAPTPALVFSMGVQFAGGRMASVAFLAGLILAGLSFIRRGDAHGPRDRWSLLFVVTWFVMPLVIVLGVSLSLKPVFVPKYLIETLPAIIILVAVGVARLPNRVAAGVVIAFLAALLVNYARRGIGVYEPWREVVQHVVTHAQPGDGVICYPLFLNLPFSYYLRRQAGDHQLLEPIPIAAGPYHPGGGAIDPPPDLKAVGQAAVTRQRMWVVMSTEGSERLNRNWRTQIHGAISTHHPERTEEVFPSPQFFDELTVTLFTGVATTGVAENAVSTPAP